MDKGNVKFSKNWLSWFNTINLLFSNLKPRCREIVGVFYCSKVAGELRANSENCLANSKPNKINTLGSSQPKSRAARNQEMFMYLPRI